MIAKKVIDLIEGFEAEVFLANRDYDSNNIIDFAFLRE